MFIGSSLAITRPRVINGGGGEPPEAVLLFSDSFDGGVIDPAKWVKSVYPFGANYNPGTGERQRYFDANLSVSGGQLIINTVKTLGDGITYTSGMINTYGLFQRTYGYYEIEMQTPAKSSVWPAFWLAPANLNWPPEIDVMKGGGGETHHIHVNSHYLISPEVYGADGGYVSVDPTAGFNRYGCNWQPGVLEFYLNRTLSYTVTEPLALPAEDMYMIVNVAVGPQPSVWPMVGDDTDPSAWSVNTYVKEVNVWDIKPF